MSEPLLASGDRNPADRALAAFPSPQKAEVKIADARKMSAPAHSVRHRAGWPARSAGSGQKRFARAFHSSLSRRIDVRNPVRSTGRCLELAACPVHILPSCLRFAPPIQHHSGITWRQSSSLVQQSRLPVGNRRLPASLTLAVDTGWLAGETRAGNKGCPGFALRRTLRDGHST